MDNFSRHISAANVTDVALLVISPGLCVGKTVITEYLYNLIAGCCIAWEGEGEICCLDNCCESNISVLQCFVDQVWIKKMCIKLIFPINISYHIRLYQL